MKSVDAPPALSAAHKGSSRIVVSNATVPSSAAPLTNDSTNLKYLHKKFKRIASATLDCNTVNSTLLNNNKDIVNKNTETTSEHYSSATTSTTSSSLSTNSTNISNLSSYNSRTINPQKHELQSANTIYTTTSVDSNSLKVKNLHPYHHNHSYLISQKPIISHQQEKLHDQLHNSSRITTEEEKQLVKDIIDKNNFLLQNHQIVSTSFPSSAATTTTTFLVTRPLQTSSHANNLVGSGSQHHKINSSDVPFVAVNNNFNINFNQLQIQHQQRVELQDSGEYQNSRAKFVDPSNFAFSNNSGNSNFVIVKQEPQQQQPERKIIPPVSLPAQSQNNSSNCSTNSANSSSQPGRHQCPYCQLICAKPSVLQKHIRAHTNERPYPCTICGFAFKTKSNLYKHCRWV